jgi:hypothetical protein
MVDDGYQGPGYMDPVTQEWFPGVNLNSNPLQVRPITTPNSSTGQPAYADPAAPTVSPQFATPQGGQLTTTTPNSRTGAPAPGIRNLPATSPIRFPFPSLGLGGPLGMTIGLLANAPRTDQEIYNQDNAVGSAVDNSWIGKKLIELGITHPSPQWGPPSAAAQPAPADQTAPPVPQSGPGYSPPGPPGWNTQLPPFDSKGNLPPFNRGPIPFNQIPNHQTAPTMQQHPAQPTPPVAPPAPTNINLGHYRATVGNARGNPTWVPQGEDAPSPQIFRGPLTMYGAGPWGQPQGSQNYYIPGSAPMGQGDWTGTGPPAGPFNAPTGGRGARNAPPPPTSSGLGPRSAPFRNLPVLPSNIAPGTIAQAPPTHIYSSQRRVAPFSSFGPGP